MEIGGSGDAQDVVAKLWVAKGELGVVLTALVRERACGGDGGARGSAL